MFCFLTVHYLIFSFSPSKMEDLKKENQKPESDDTLKEFPAEKVTVSQENVAYNNKTLKRVLKHLSRLKTNKRKQSSKIVCSPEDYSDLKVDDQVKLRCRQLPSVVIELRRAIMRQDWEEATVLVMILCHPGLKYYSSIIIKVCFVLLLSHPNSSLSLLQDFIRLTTGYILEEDVNKFIRVLFALRKDALQPLETGKYIRRTGDYKVVRDPEFDKL